MRVFLDANVLFSAAKSDGPVRHLLARLLDAGHECWVDGFVLVEAQRNLARKAPAGLAVLDELLPQWHEAGLEAAGSAIEAELPLPDKDRPVLAAAVHCGCQALLTGDRTHFAALYGRTFGGVTVHSPRSIAEALLA